MHVMCDTAHLIKRCRRCICRHVGRCRRRFGNCTNNAMHACACLINSRNLLVNVIYILPNTIIIIVDRKLGNSVRCYNISTDLETSCAVKWSCVSWLLGTNFRCIALSQGFYLRALWRWNVRRWDTLTTILAQNAMKTSTLRRKSSDRDCWTRYYTGLRTESVFHCADEALMHASN